MILPKKRIEANHLPNTGQPKNKEEKIMEKVLAHRYENEKNKNYLMYSRMRTITIFFCNNFVQKEVLTELFFY